MKDYNLENRRFVIGGVATIIVVVYILRLFTLQLMSDDYKKNADSNAFLKKVEFPSRGAITDRNGKLLVYNQPAYDIMVVMNEESGRLDTTEFCQTLGITKSFYKAYERHQGSFKEPRLLALHAAAVHEPAQQSGVFYVPGKNIPFSRLLCSTTQHPPIPVSLCRPCVGRCGKRCR